LAHDCRLTGRLPLHHRPDLGGRAAAASRAHVWRTSTAALQAYQALQTLSAIAELARARDIQPPVEAAVQAAVSQFQQARQAIADLAGDQVVDEILATLDTLAGLVQEELDAPAEADDLGLAANIAKGLEEPNDDPASAQRLLST
jgi:ribosomal protein L17